MKAPSTRTLMWGGIALLLATTVASCVQERHGHDTYFEIVCRGEPRACLPSGHRVVLARQGVGQPRGSLRVEEFDAEDRLVTRVDLPQCLIPDVHQFLCRKPLTATIATLGSADTAPWRMVQGRLFNDEALDGTHYLNPLQLWRNRLLLGDYTP